MSLYNLSVTMLKMIERVIEIKTIKEVANLIDKSRTSVYNLIKKNNIETFKKDGKTYIDDNAVSLILAYYSVEQQETIQDIIIETKEQEKTEDCQANCNQCNHNENDCFISFLEHELEEKNKTIQGLIQALTVEKQLEVARLLSNNQYKQQQTEPTTKPTEETKGFFKNFFKK